MVRRIFLVAVLMASLCASAVPPQWAADTLAAMPYMRHASLGIAVEDLTTGEIVAGHNIELSCITASTMKTVVSLAALDMLGADYRFATPVYLDGTVSEGTLRGDVVVVGSGDPSLASRFLKQDSDLVQQTVTALRGRGINHITGCIVVDASLYGTTTPYHCDWNVNDLGWDYGTGIHAFNWRDNLVELSLDMDSDGIGILYTTPSVPGLRLIDNAAYSSSGSSLDYAMDYGTPAIIVVGQADAGNHSLTAANPLPQSLFAAELTHALESAGITVGNKAGSREGNDRTLLVSHLSVTVAEIIRSLLDRSDNMMAHALLRAIGARDKAYAEARSGNTSYDLDRIGVSCVKRCLEGLGVDTSPLFMRDGSGLARANKSSVHFFVDMLRVAETRDYNGVKLRHLMPEAGKRVGEPLSSSPLSHDIVLKSGSMSDVQCFVGYWPADAPRYSWAVLANNYTCPRPELRSGLGRLLVDLFGVESRE